MRVLILVLLLLALAVGVGVLTHNEPGYVFIGYAQWSLETTLAVLLGAVVVVFLILHGVLRLLHGLAGVPQRLRDLSVQKQAARARHLLNRGLIELAEGRWQRAERLLTHPLVREDSPMIAALTSAQAAQRLGAHDRRDRYLKEAAEQDPSAVVAVSLTQAELQTRDRQFEQALATLQRLRELAPRQHRVLRLLARVYRELEDWQGLSELLPELRKRDLLPGERLERLSVEAWLGLLEQANCESLEACRQRWAALPRAARERPELLHYYVEVLLGHDAGAEAERLLRAHLNRRWDPALVRDYGLLRGADAHRMLEQAEAWLRDHGRDPLLLLTLGRLCVQRQLWGKARIYFESSIEQQPLAETHLELARLLEGMGEQDGARDQYRLGLIQASGEAAKVHERLGGPPGSAVKALPGGVTAVAQAAPEPERKVPLAEAGAGR